MKQRPLGITIMAALAYLNVAVYALLAVLALVNPEALAALLRALSPGGSGPEKVHLAMGKLLPVYYAAMMVLTVPLAMGLWKLWNWVRWFVLAMIGVSMIALVTVDVGPLRNGGAGAIALFLLRVGLCLWIGWYLLSGRVRAAFRKRGPHEPGSESNAY